MIASEEQQGALFLSFHTLEVMGCGLTWEGVGQRMRYDKRQSQRIHKRALEDVQRQMDARGIRA